MAVMFTQDAVYRELEPLYEGQYCREVTYSIECQLWYTPAEGDGWDSPFLEATLELEQWLITEITRHNLNYNTIYRPGFIGPAEPDLVWFEDLLELTEEEVESIIQNAWNEAER